MKIFLKIAFCVLLSLNLSAQIGTKIIRNGTLHLGNGEVIESGVLVFEQGKIVELGSTQKGLYKNAVIIDAKGKHVYPGLIAMNNIMGLNEIDAIRATKDYNEQGEFNPNVRTLIAYNTDSKILPTALFNGVLYTQAVPQGGVISGSSSLMKTKAWNWEDAVVKADEGVHLNWPYLQIAGMDPNKHGEKLIAEIATFFAEAKQYQSMKTPVFNARLAAMKGIFTGTQNLYIHANDARSMLRSIHFFKNNYPEIHLVIVGGQEAYLIAAVLKEFQIPVVLGNIHRLPARNADGIDQPYQLPAQLENLGIKFALSFEGSWEARNLAYVAGTAAAYGLNKEAALKAICLSPAEIMGVSDRIGSLAVGKDASILICNGDLLDMKSSELWQVYLCGEAIDFNNEQVKLYQKYMDKYKLN